MAAGQLVERDLAQVARWLESMDANASDAPEIARLAEVARGMTMQARADTIDTDDDIADRARALVDEVQALMLARLDAVRRPARRIGRRVGGMRGGARGRETNNNS